MFRAESLELLARHQSRFSKQVRELRDKQSEVPPLGAEDPDAREDPDDCVPRLAVRVAEPNVEKIYTLPALPAPLPSEMPSSFWTPLLFGKPDDIVSSENAPLALMLIEARGRAPGDGRCVA